MLWQCCSRTVHAEIKKVHLVCLGFVEICFFDAIVLLEHERNCVSCN